MAFLQSCGPRTGILNLESKTRVIKSLDFFQECREQGTTKVENGPMTVAEF
jgi:hypothetical protein